MESLVRGVNSISSETTNKTRVILVHFLMAYSGLGTRSSNLILILFEVNRLSKPRIFLLTAEVRSRFIGCKTIKSRHSLQMTEVVLYGKVFN